MSKEGAAKQDRVSDEKGKTGVQEYIDKLQRLDLIYRVGVTELKAGIEHNTDKTIANV